MPNALLATLLLWWWFLIQFLLKTDAKCSSGYPPPLVDIHLYIHIYIYIYIYTIYTHIPIVDMWRFVEISLNFL